ncbi:MMPL family transporter [Corynebacterium auriscanis]|uniref:MMPL family transporter n=1 Tax=Corynebacterium auriscanis TaxID=99807 RepID=UPI003CFAFBE3
MAKLLYKIGRGAYANRWKVLALWLLVLIGVGVASATLQKPTSTSFTIPGLESVETQQELKSRFNTEQQDQLEAPTGKLVIQAPQGKTLEDKDVAQQVDELTKALQGESYLTEKDKIVSPVLAAKGMEAQLGKAKAAQGLPKEQIAEDLKALSPLSEDKTTGQIDVAFDAEKAMDIEQADKDKFGEVVNVHKGELKIGWTGNAFQAGGQMDGKAELIGMAVAAIVLIVTFGSFVAAGLPLMTAVTGVGTGIALVFAATRFSDNINNMTPTLASMIGLAVGIDYALFILARFRNELVAHVDGSNLEPKDLADKLKTISFRERAHLAGLAVGKAGSAVVFAGLTVLIALAALTIINIPFLTAMALAAAGTVAIAVVVSITLLPAIIGAIGTKVFAGRAPIVKAPDPENDKPTMGLKWARIIRKRPALFLIAGVVVLVLLAIPAGQLRLAMPSDGSTKLGSPTRTAYEMTDEAFGPGRNAPMIALLDYQNVDKAQQPKATQEALTTIGDIEGVDNVQVVATNGNPKDPRDLGDAAQLLITPSYGATDARAADVLQAMRDAEGQFRAETGADYRITGVTPMYEDISQRLSDALLPYVGIVILLAFLLLMVVFRSIWVPLVAALGFALSVAATFGVTVALWQLGWGGIVADPQPIISFLPIMLIGIVFGLAMDYQVFLVTRMREGWTHGKTPGNAVSNGYKHGARVVTAAALIMISVFSAFMLLDEPFIKVMGFALAAAVLIDAFIVRMTLIPAIMYLLDEGAWKLPKWMNRILPKVDVEGESLQGLRPTEEVADETSGASATKLAK